jgi:CRP-like cAMP-binding protein
MLTSLAEDPDFGSVPAPVLHGLVDGAEICEASKGSRIYEAGERWGRLGFVIEGSVAMFANGEDAKEHLYEHAHPGQFFGVSAMFDGGAEMAQTVVVSSRARCALIDGAFALAACKQHGTLAVAFAITLARRVRRTTSLLAAQMNLTAQERIARYLLGFTSGPSRSPALDPLPLMTQAQIGAAAGTVKDVAARTIGVFERRGALVRERGHIRWLHRERLRELARLAQTDPA